MLLHGWALHGGAFAPLLPALVARHRVHVVDLPGHGHSPPMAQLTLDAIVDAVAAAVTPLAEGAPLDVLGWSFGGLVAQRWAARAGGGMARLILVCTSPRFVAGDGWTAGIAPQVLAQFGDELRVAYDATLRRFLMLQMQHATHARTTLARMRELLAARPPADRATLDATLAILQSSDLRDQAPAMGMPALVVAGGRDTLAPAAAGAWLADAMPDAILATIADAAHVPFLSHPRAFDAALRGFFDGHHR
ncbi:MAG TPA: pimeloyl-ACP methyl ester esterase BioH [Casimicrobiaceae bacterium]|nr:pimeloyl-ACP methyl ester esterase BioH [Casimicrobiaceae bacterium]